MMNAAETGAWKSASSFPGRDKTGRISRHAIGMEADRSPQGGFAERAVGDAILCGIWAPTRIIRAWRRN